MGDCKRLKFCWPCSSSSYKLLLVIVSLILVTGLVSLVGPNTFTWGSASWTWKPGFPSSFLTTVTTATTTTSSSAKESETFFELHPSVVEVHQIEEKEEALSDASTFNRSSSPSLAKQTLQIQQQPPITESSAAVHHLKEEVEEVEEEEEKALSDTSIFNRSSLPPLAQETDEEIQEGLRSSMNGSDVIPVVTRVERTYSKMKRLEVGLARARAAIRETTQNGSTILESDYVPIGPMYWNASTFHRSYLEMEKQFKIFIYKEGEPPLFHNGPCKSIYSMEGNFIHNMEMNHQFQTQDPDKAHVYFLPFSVTMLVRYVYDRINRNIEPLKQTVIDYVNTVAEKYPYWNRSLGADHFMLACHDWGPMASTYVPDLYKNSIRVLCNANTSEGFNPSKDASFPEVNLKTGDINGFIGGPSPSKRPILAFFAGGLHGPIRPVLLDHWKNKDKDVQVYEYLPKGMSYYDMMKKSKFCICPSGYEVASPRIVEAIYLGCVPVLISDHYVPPFSDVLNWKSFSVEVGVHEIPNLKRILMGISSRNYIRMQRRGIKVRQHFEVNSPPKRFDVFHMILHSIWLRRLNVHIDD